MKAPEAVFLDLETKGLYGMPEIIGTLKPSGYRTVKPCFGCLRFLADGRRVIGYNLKYDLKVALMRRLLTRRDLRKLVIEDVFNMTRLLLNLDSYSLAEVVASLFSGKYPSWREGLSFSQLRSLNYRQLVWLRRVYKSLKDELEEQGVTTAYWLENQLVPLLAEMEFFGIKVDTNRMGKISKKIHRELAAIEQKLKKWFGGINLNSSQQLGEVLFGKLKLKPPFLTATGRPSTSAEALEALAGKHQAIDILLRYRSLAKLASTYLNFNKEIHCEFDSFGAATGRFSSRNPNMQNIPRDDEFGLRSVFIPREGHLFIDIDFEQMELRMMAHVANDTAMIECFSENRDLHDEVSQRFGIDRIAAKAINFGIIYGMSPEGLANTIKIPLEKAEEYLRKWFATFSGIKAFSYEVFDFWKKHRFVRTITGRKRYLFSEGDFGIGRVRRQAINTVVQGSSAEACKWAMNLIFRDKELLRLGAKLLLNVHDELLLEVPRQNAKRAAKIAEQLCIEAGKQLRLRVPLVVNVGIGQSWAEAKS